MSSFFYAKNMQFIHFTGQNEDQPASTASTAVFILAADNMRYKAACARIERSKVPTVALLQ